MRVIAGSARGHPLRAPSSTQIRPTADKIKGVIFSMLEAEAYRRGVAPDPGDDERADRFAAAVAWPRVLELYAGSGALAIEALSRGAERADLVESNADARKMIAENLRRTGLAERARVHATTSAAAVSTLPGPYDLILLDPPYDEPGVAAVVERLVARGLTSPSAVLVWEHRRTATPPDRIGAGAAPGGWRRARTNTHGAVSVSLYLADRAE
jgi:16S rRNA (guanine966-N2)-methyltransferase